MKLLQSIWFPVFLGVVIILVIVNEIDHSPQTKIYFPPPPETKVKKWTPPDIESLANDSVGMMIRYGRDLIANTAKYFGPKGMIAPITNGMNCQNCHIEAGSRPFGNCLSAVAANYPTPQPRPRSGMKESIEFRINDCMQRSLNGEKIDSLSKEMRAMVAYLKWLGKDVPKGVKPEGSGVKELAYLERAADPVQGGAIYHDYCQRCHGANGEGQLNVDKITYKYPPLWGKNSYNTGAGLYRLSRIAAYVKDNMPFDKASHLSPVLSDDAAWDVAAYIVSQPRPQKKFNHDWPILANKPVDYPFGPFTDGFSETQHKYGPFNPIKQAKDVLAQNKR